jgi:hypothetical protein
MKCQITSTADKQTTFLTALMVGMLRETMFKG